MVQTDHWVFGYGSLIYKVDFPVRQREIAALSGWERRFWQGSHDHRGTPEAPGRVVTLVPAAGARCRGVAYRVEESVFAHLDHREKNGYERHHSPIYLEERDEWVMAVFYIAAEGNPAFLGDASIAEIARHIDASHGPSGSNADYLLRLADALRSLKEHDAHTMALEAELLRRRPALAENIACLSHADCSAHDMGPSHPEQPARLTAIHERLGASMLSAALRHYDAPLAGDDTLALAHDAAYLHALETRSPTQGMVWLDEDTAMNPHSLRAARRAAGAVVKAVDLVLQGDTKRAFCSVRPPGHHAERDKAMGFCFYNNIAIGALHALKHHGLARVAIVDFDVHHGNGTEHIVAGDERILFCSTFQHPFYPGSGHECDAANVVNVPLPRGTGSAQFRAAVTEHWLPALDRFAPELILVSAGFDAHEADDMAGINLVDADYRWITEALVALARRHAGGRLVSALEGGYELPSLARSVEAHLQAMVGTP